ncbi:MAG: hypothetical protein CMQ29_14330 [Gammaproteobacteria bacterium]|nr:hypothetical protein [Gammaproteobacteria bacterium]
MRLIAEFSMRSRAHALGVALAGTIIEPLLWIASGVVALVTLRHGLREGTFIMIVALAPHLFMFWSHPHIVAILLPLQAAILAMVLRETRSWQLAVLSAPVLGMALTLATYLVAPGAIEEPVRLASEMTGRNLTAQPGFFAMLPPFLAFMLTMMALGCLALGRWWQSVLYNPGGFGGEFQALRLSTRITGGLVAVACLCMAALPGPYTTWFLPLTAPLVMAALGITHYVVNQRGLGAAPLVAYYIALLMGFLTVVLLPFLLLPAVFDSFLDVRARMARRTRERSNLPEDKDDDGD